MENKVKLTNIVHKTRENIESSIIEIDNIIKDTNIKVFDYKTELLEINTRLGSIIPEVDKLNHELRNRTKLHSEWEHNVLVEKLKSLMQDEEKFLTRRNVIESYLRNNEALSVKAEQVLIQVKTMLEILDEHAGTSEHIERILLFQELEKKRLSRDMHDGPAQTMAGTVLKIEYASKFIGKSPEIAIKELMSIKTDIRTTIKEIRDIIFNLTPLKIGDVGLTKAVVQYTQRNPDIDWDIDIQERDEIYKKPVLVDNLFRIYQELINNIIKYSKTDKAIIRIQITKDNILGLVQDFGKGFDIKNISRGYGINNVRDRIELIGGKVTFVSNIGEGTKIEIKIPITEHENIRNG